MTWFPFAYVVYYIYVYGADYSSEFISGAFGTFVIYLFQLLFNFVIGYVVIAFMSY